MNTEELHFIVISDSVGETARKLIEAVVAQFPDLKAIMHHHPFVRDEKGLKKILENAKKVNGLVIHTLVIDDLSSYTDSFCKEEGLLCYDILKPLVQDITALTSMNPSKRAGALHSLDDEYFNRISAIEFAVRYDDGRDAKGLLEADLVLLGVSRTSKTPLSIFLANKNVRVANLPILPEASIPDELWEVNPKKIVGLTNDMEVLINFRRERMIAYGLSPDTVYSNKERIGEELQFASDLYEKLDCYVINVARRSIEETAEIIMKNVLKKK